MRGVDLRRLVRLARVVVLHLIAHAWGERLLRHAPRLARRLPHPEVTPPVRLRLALEELGGTFIKLGQMLALQPDILSLRYCDALFELLDRVEPFSWEEAERVVREELGASPDELFDDFDRQPLATASIGQVYVARRAGRRVAVKVQRPCVDVDFAGDIRLMRTLLVLIRVFRLRPLQWMVEPLSEFITWTREELDYRQEARYMARLGALDDRRQRVPEVHADLTTRRTLVMEFFEGVTLLDYMRARESGDREVLRRVAELGFDPTRFAENVIDNFVGDAFRHGIYHADLHPANLMILRDNVVGYVDFGITGLMSAHARRHLTVMTLALARGDIARLGEHFLRIATVGEDADPEGFVRDLGTLAEGWYVQDGREKRLVRPISLLMGDMLHLSRRADVLPQLDVIRYIRSAIAIDGLVGRFEPDFDVGRHLASVCERQLKWQAMRSSMSYDRLLRWWSHGASLATHGTRRVAGMLDRVAAGELPVRVGIDDAGSRDAAALRGRAIQLGGLSLLLAALMWATPTAPGFDLLAAEGLVLGACLIRLTGALRRLSREGARTCES